MRKRSDKDKTSRGGGGGGGGTATGTVQQIASTNSTVNLFLGGSKNVRSWMNCTNKESEVAEGGCDDRCLSTTNTTTNTTNTTVLPSPAPSDEPSPAQETSPRRVVDFPTRQPLVTGRRRNTPVASQGVRSPSGQLSLMMIREGSTGQAVRSPSTLQSPIVIDEGNNTNNAGQAMQSPSTQQRSPIVIEGGNRNNMGQEVQSPLTQQQTPTTQQGYIGAERQVSQSTSSQRPTPMNGQGHTNAESAVYHGHSMPGAAPPAAKRRKLTSANSPGLKAVLPIIELHLSSYGGIGALGGTIEGQRFRMLQDACRNDDYFYVALHQMFCLWHLDPNMTAGLTMPQGGHILEKSFAILSKLVMHNKNIPLVHTTFFSRFPNQLSELMCRSDQYRLAVNNVSMFLTRLSLDWAIYVSECAQRGYPPLVDELVNRFGLLSPILQHIAFTATRRNMGFHDDEHGAQMEQLFTRDRELHLQMAARVNTAYPPTEREINDRNLWQVNQYLNLRTVQLQRMGQARATDPAHMGPNVARSLQQNLQARVPSLSNIPAATQAGQQPTIRTNIMPSEVLTASPLSATVPSQRHVFPSQVVASQQTPNGSVSEHPLRSPMQSPISRPHQTLQGYPISPNQQNMQNQAQTMQQPYQPNQTQNMQHRQSLHRQGQVNDIARTASRNASRNASQPQFSGVGSAGSSPVMANQVRRGSSSAYNSTALAIANLPAGYSSAKPQQQQQQQVGRVPLVPPVGYTAPYQFPQPDRSALHQAHLRSPVLRAIDAGDGVTANQPAQKYYQAVQSFAAGPTTLLDSPMLTELSFVVPKPEFLHVAEDRLIKPTAPLFRGVRQGTLQYRVRCARLNDGAAMEPSDFVVADTSWPPTIFMEMNDSVLEIRRKNHHGKDRPVDITPHVVDRGPKKENMLRVSVPRPATTGTNILYSIAIEVVEVFRHQQIVDMCLKEQRITAKDMIEDIKAKLSNSKADEDDDVALVSANLTIDLADPFTSRIFTIPVRGVRCRHRECFDLETFLTSRSNKPHEVACMPDVWKCPLCGGDASPRSLRVDDFLVSVREKLEREGELDVKAILVTEDGAWTVKPEAGPAARRKSRGIAGSVPRDDGDYKSPPVRSRQGSRAVEVIEVDDD
ncbi:hypothetical protein V493_03882 [Pseudogymnoascus sp. VKM F-4281 (FW-2241)]|nr:hypothetical protein V493_03882 [Pseudogymnoascus sp. VKM F-4281 (FW-2241)]